MSIASSPWASGWPRPVKSCAAELSHSPHIWADSSTWAGGANFVTFDCPGVVHIEEVMHWRARALSAEAALAALAGPGGADPKETRP